MHFQVLAFHFLCYTAIYPDNSQAEVLLLENSKIKQLYAVQLYAADFNGKVCSQKYSTICFLIQNNSTAFP